MFPQGGGVCNNLELKFHVIKDNKGKIRPRSRENKLVGITCDFFMAKEIGKRKETIIGI